MRDLDVVIVNWNRLRETRESVLRLRGWQRLQPRVTVVDNGSTDGSAEALSGELAETEIVRSPENLGYGGGNNLALRRLEGDYVLLLNNDAEIDEASVERMIELLAGRPEVAVVGPVIAERSESGERLKAGGRDISIHADTHVELDSVPPERRRDGTIETDYVSGTAALLRTAVLRQLGLLDEEYFFGGELADLCERARRLGYRSVIEISARAVHHADTAGSDRSALYPYYILRNRFLYVRRFRRGGALLLFPYWTARGLYGIVRALAKGQRSTARALRLGLTDGWLGRFGGANERVLG